MTDPALSAVLWDMDGTIIDSEPLWIEAETEMLDRYGIAMSEATHRMLIGSGLTAAAELFRELGVPLTVDEILAEWEHRVGLGMLEAGVLWRPGARELLASLGAAGIPCALVTMSTRPLADRVVEMLPAGTFSASVTGDEVEHEKPHPEPYLRGAEALGVPIEHCLVIEDSPTGLRSAIASGAVSIGVPNLIDLDPSAADELWPTLDGLGAGELSESFARLRARRPVSLDLRP